MSITITSAELTLILSALAARVERLDDWKLRHEAGEECFFMEATYHSLRESTLRLKANIKAQTPCV